MSLKKLFLILVCSTVLNTTSIFSSDSETIKQPETFFNLTGASLLSTGAVTAGWFGLKRFAPHIIKEHGETKVAVALGLFGIFSSSYFATKFQRSNFRNYAKLLAEKETHKQFDKILSQLKTLEKTNTKQQGALNTLNEKVGAVAANHDALRSAFDTRVGAVDTRLDFLTHRQQDRTISEYGLINPNDPVVTQSLLNFSHHGSQAGSIHDGSQ